MVEQALDGHAGPHKNRHTAHDFRIGVNDFLEALRIHVSISPASIITGAVNGFPVARGARFLAVSSQWFLLVSLGARAFVQRLSKCKRAFPQNLAGAPDL